ncbi:MAG: DegT/DnrJ/EryC1/StrS family aminotransferase [Candidatus Nitrosotenuis sp.]
MGKNKIKLFDPIFGREEKLIIQQVLESRFWASGAGTGKVGEFEAKFNEYVGSDYCVAMNNGTAALHLALSLFDIRNKEVIIPSLSFVSTAHAVVYNGGKPIFVDVEPDTMCLDPDMIKKVISKKTKVILPVHFAGMPCKLDEIQKLCDESNSSLVEDAAHAAGATYKNKKIGNYGDATCFSFHPVKNLAMPTGGAVTLKGNNSKKFCDMLKARRWCGISNRKGSTYEVNELGWNYYMNEFSAAIGLTQLQKLDQTNKRRKEIAKRYSEKIDVDKKMPFNKECSYHFYWIFVKKRDNFIKKMAQNNIETGIHYMPIHKMGYYRQKTSLKNTELAGQRITSLPTHPNLTNSDVDRIIELTNKFA